MADFVQIHLLAAYPPANLNRDDTGRPKTAIVGGAPRLRVSSQSLKRAWRTSAVFAERLTGRLGERTQRLGEKILDHLKAGGMDEAKALETARAIADIFGKLKSGKDANAPLIEQLAFIAPEERAAAFALADRALAGEQIDEKTIRNDAVLRRTDTAADIAMFGRMLADDPEFNRDAAVQVAHAFTTHRAVVEDDYYTAVDDLQRSSDDEGTGAGFVGEQGFGAGIFYLYLCIDRDLLRANLGGDGDLAKDAISALLQAATTVGPRGKVASFASHARAFYAMVEKGPAQPRSLAFAFVRSVAGEDPLKTSIDVLEDFRDRLGKAYGDDPEHLAMNVLAKGGATGTLAELVAFATAD